ncbi:MAG: FAD-dependent oxidoreductase, partial [Microvirga sp.]
MKKTIGVIGAGMVGVAAASFLRREGHDVFLVEPGNPGEGTSFGNAGCLNGSSVVPMSMPGTIKNVPRWLTDPMGPLVIRWSYLPTLAPWLIRFIAAGRPEKVREQAKALRAILGPSLATLAPLLKDAGAEDLVKKAGHLFVYRSEESFRKESLAWQLRRDNGVTWDEFDADELRQLEPTLS